MSANQTPFNLTQQLDRYFLACSALVGVATLAGTQSSNASIIYSGIQNINVPTTNGAGGLYLDIATGGIFIPTTSGGGPAEGLNTLLPGWDINPYRSGGGNLRAWYNNNTYFVYNGANHVAALGSGVMVDGSSPLGTFQTMVPEWTDTEAFLGIQFRDAGNNTRYGWLRFDTGPANGLPATLVDWAYEDSGAGILTGAGIVPEPSSVALGCLAAGAVGIGAWRKRKKAA